MSFARDHSDLIFWGIVEAASVSNAMHMVRLRLNLFMQVLMTSLPIYMHVSRCTQLQEIDRSNCKDKPQRPTHRLSAYAEHAVSFAQLILIVRGIAIATLVVEAASVSKAMHMVRLRPYSSSHLILPTCTYASRVHAKNRVKTMQPQRPTHRLSV